MDWHGDLGRPESAVQSLIDRGFHEYKRELARTGRHHTAGGLWLGLDERSGAVASVIWVTRGGDDERALVFVDIEPQRESAVA
jgi:hypothetical protein